MKFIRLAALFGSLVLLVATAVSFANRRGDLRDDQLRSVQESATIASGSVRGVLTRVRQDVHLATVAVARTDGADDPVLASELVRFFPGADVCVGATASGCTGADLFSLEAVGLLAAESDRVAIEDAEDQALASIAVDTSTDTLLVVRRIATEESVSTVALRLPVDSLLNEEARRLIEASGADVTIVAVATSAGDDRSSVESDGRRRVITEVFGSPFAEGSVAVESSVDGTIGIAGDQSAKYGVLLALGTVLLALAGWTFLVERRQLERRATTDELTGLINRREFERISEIALDDAERATVGLCVMVVDLNGFKQVNDTLGHQFGDLVLEACSERLVAAVRETDTVGRWGGDEFVILLPGLSERTAVRKSAERIWQSLAGSPVVGDTMMTASIGAAIFPRHGTTLDSLMRSADVAMYEAKTTGVSHRIADTIVVAEALTHDEHGESDARSPVITAGYAGPDRRHSPVPPPPRPTGDLAAPQPLDRVDDPVDELPLDPIDAAARQRSDTPNDTPGSFDAPSIR